MNKLIGGEVTMELIDKLASKITAVLMTVAAAIMLLNDSTWDAKWFAFAAAFFACERVWRKGP